MKKILLLLFANCLLMVQVFAIDDYMEAKAPTNQGKEVFEYFSIHYSVFNSTLLNPKIASLHGFVRGDKYALVNVFVEPKPATKNSYGMKAQVIGEMKNLMQQRKSLSFKEIRESNATYYLALFKFEHLEPTHFSIEVSIPSLAVTERVKFTHRLYQDNR